MKPSAPATHGGAEVRGSPGAAPRIAGLLRLVWPLLAGALAAGWLIRAALPLPPLEPATAGILLVLLAAGLAAMAGWNRRRMGHFLKGAAGEEFVARELARLPAGHLVLHGVRLGAVDLDHVVLGPAGLFVVETKNWSGPVTVQGGRILLGGREPDRPPLAQVRGAADALRRHLAGAGLGRLTVQPIVTFVSDACLDREEIGVEGVVLCRASVLGRVLKETTESPFPADVVERASVALRTLGD